jgi:hypothetical protein
MGGLNKNSPSQGVGKVKIIKSENTKIFVLFVLLRWNKYHLLYISICKVFHLNLNECWGWVKKSCFFEGWVTKQFGQESVSPQWPQAINNDWSLSKHFGTFMWLS